MRIAEVAELAGVTVRTIRYYHQVGALPEPARRPNGYRSYTVDHLVTLLIIVQLTRSGLSLTHAGAVAAGSAASTDEALDEVDQALQAEITALSEQRERLARARAGGHVGLSRKAAALSLSTNDAPIAILFAHLYADDPHVSRFAEALLEPERRSALAAIQDQFEAIDETTADADLEDLSSRLRSVVADLVDELPPLAPAQSQLLLTLVDRRLNDRQRDFLHGQA